MKFLIVIPHYNHFDTLAHVARACSAYGPVAVFDDGSSHSPENILQNIPVTLVRFEKNRGKGAVLKEAAAYALAHGFTHIITVDADGQHNPADIPALQAAQKAHPQDIIIGVRQMDKTVPLSSRFGRQFGGFWVRVQTGKACADIQSGLRVYPACVLTQIPTRSNRYAFEVEIVVRACWAGLAFSEVPVSVFYPKTRLSHFDKLADNLRLTVLNTHLTFLSMLPIPRRRYTFGPDGLLHKQPFAQTLKTHLQDGRNRTHNALSAAWGIFCGSIALPGIRQVFLFGGSGWWNLNRMVSISFEKLCIGPIVPAFCIETGYFLRYGHFLTEFNLTTLGRQFLSRVWEWFVGSLVVAPVLAAVTFGVVWLVGFYLHRSLK